MKAVTSLTNDTDNQHDQVQQSLAHLEEKAFTEQQSNVKSQCTHGGENGCKAISVRTIILCLNTDSSHQKKIILPFLSKRN